MQNLFPGSVRTLNRHVWAAAFRVTVPVLIGYLAIGIAFGLMLEAIGYNFIWSFFMSCCSWGRRCPRWR